MDFIRSTSEKMNLWPVEHLFPPFFSRSALNQHWSGKKRGKKVFNWSEVHFFGSTCYEIHILMNFGIINSVKMTQQIDEIKFMSRQKVHIPWMSGQPRGCAHFFWCFKHFQLMYKYHNSSQIFIWSFQSWEKIHN